MISASFFGLLLNRKHLIINLIAIEVLLLVVVLNFFIFSAYIGEDTFGLIFTVIIFSVAGVESALGLALILCYFRLKGTIVINFFNIMKG